MFRHVRPAISRLLWRIGNVFTARVAILLYHRIMELPSDPHGLCVAPSRFAHHLQILRQDYHPMSLAALVRALESGRIPDRSVVVTFDDGYADNSHHAVPLLERYGVPATIFVTAGSIGSRREFWWDELENLLLVTPRLPESLCLKIRGSTFQWQMTDDVDIPTVSCMNAQHQGSGAHPTVKTRRGLYYAVCEILRHLDEETRKTVLGELSSWVGRVPEVRESHAVMTAEEVRTLGRTGLIEIGAHTMSHTVLSDLPDTAQKREVEQSKQYLEEIVGRPVRCFAYPHGGVLDYTRSTVDIVRSAGFESSCTTIPRLVMAGEEAFQLPRFIVPDLEPEHFAAQLASWFHA